MIAEIFAEAVLTLHANCPRASVVMARRALEAVTEDKGESKGSLAERLRTLAAKGELISTLADWATEVRLIGNTGAHFDPFSAVSMEDAEQMIAFMHKLLHYLYELPAQLKAARESRSVRN